MVYDLEYAGKLLDNKDAMNIIQTMNYKLNLKPQNQRFPGWHAITLLKRHINNLINCDYFACEKSDGIRALLYIMNYKNKSYHFLIDRKLSVYQIQSNKSILYEYILDGEFLISKSNEMYFIIFDTIYYNSRLVINNNLLERLQFADKLIRTLKNENFYSFGLSIKKMYKSYGFAEAYITRDTLTHECDGLMFTRVNAPYVFGTCNTLYKWKPPHLNTIDFEMRNEEKNVYSLWCMRRMGGMSKIGYYFDYDIDDDHIRDQKINDNDDINEYNGNNGSINNTNNNKQYHNKIGEFFFNQQAYSVDIDDDHAIIPGKWELIKIREDKDKPNSFKVVSNIFMSMKENITYNNLIDKFDEIRTNWKIREKRRDELRKEIDIYDEEIFE